MNIFYLDSDPKTCAEMHVDKHAVKMILEYAQLLSTAHRVLDGTPQVVLSKSGRKQTIHVLPDWRDQVLYKATHVNHPSAIWVRQSKENYDFLYLLWRRLMNEYTHRYGKVHACDRMVLALNVAPTNLKSGVFTEPTPAMPDTYKVPGNSIQSYRNYYLGDKSRMFSWKNRNKPHWIP